LTQPLVFSRKKPGKEGRLTTKAVLKPNFYNYTISPNINKEESREKLQVSVKKLAELNRIPIGDFVPEKEKKPRRVPTAAAVGKKSNLKISEDMRLGNFSSRPAECATERSARSRPQPSRENQRFSRKNSLPRCAGEGIFS
jgi:hypothetical protein